MPPSVLGLIVDLLCFCVVHHSYRIKYYILRNNVLSKVLPCSLSPERLCAYLQVLSTLNLSSASSSAHCSAGVLEQT